MILRTISTSTSAHFSHPVLSKAELLVGCKLGIDSYVDTSCSGRHTHVIEFIEGKEITAKAWDNHTTKNLKIANVAYSYDSPAGEVFILIVNQTIYGGEFMEDSLLQPIQCLNNGVQINTNPKHYYPDDISAQSLRYEDYTLPIEYFGPLPYIHVRRPTESEFKSCTHLQLTSHDEWDPYNILSAIHSIRTETKGDLSDTTELQLISDLCSISTELMDNNYFSALDDYRELYADSSTPANEYRAISALK